MGHDLDVGRRVIQCGCWRAAPSPARATARLQGWRGRWSRGRDGMLQRTWLCPACAAKGPSASGVAGALELRDAVARGGDGCGPAGALALLDEHLEADPDGVAWFFEQLFRSSGLLAANGTLHIWQSWAEARGYTPPPLRSKRRLARRRH